MTIQNALILANADYRKEIGCEAPAGYLTEMFKLVSALLNPAENKMGIEKRFHSTFTKFYDQGGFDKNKSDAAFRICRKIVKENGSIEID